MDQFICYLVNTLSIKLIHSWIGPKTKLEIQRKTKEIKGDSRVHGLNAFVEVR